MKQTYDLPAVGTWPVSRYFLNQESRDAIDLAVACGRPLLVRGLPGTGKSDLARAAAEYLGRAFVYEVITARTDPQDLLWRFDAIARLADAQAQYSVPNRIDPLSYVSPGPLWWALDWGGAEKFLASEAAEMTLKRSAQRPDDELVFGSDRKEQQKSRAAKQGTVLLLDEIDKAESELPNSLLEVLANTGFRLPWGNAEIKNNLQVKPLIMITTNEDRELPPAFLRRCLVLTINPSTDFVAWVKARARVHFRDPEQVAEDDRPALTERLIDAAANYLQRDRNSIGNEGPKPGLAEYLDLLRGLYHLAPNDEQKQLEWLEKVYRFAYQKSAIGD